ncbi:membrane protein insertion efficiency factor YidD [Prosthecochloris sp. HL-130-GSB]|uniref:Putative membrane protein insertion efficiency factor n=1 Tax=Prosthecochloris aestuarii TaxID=1102 RepID=A0A831WN14_PROAE|nr:membrane protein insertion efficiency factor YidD [Prosthecochloris sp. HL-130-GSB]ARM31804.1 membrane protein insertion efficiency factor YidD [Prosthecochloris sp. HL-130-GSB]MBO8092378.1 membrane protein insertion efficiency factor YidD [Prosthecochloris sp.]HED30188.1 membrane protein insertion efficiency factor YidD [Prosthecochloris aestuarii]
MKPNSFWKTVNRIPILLITFYRSYISPLTGPSCRFYPTCSRYAIDAYERYNFFYATLLTVWRILRCNPFSKGGYDPVPLPGTTSNSKKVNNG